MENAQSFDGVRSLYSLMGHTVRVVRRPEGYFAGVYRTTGIRIGSLSSAGGS